jgi:predicted SAM-dependent methyltransferase
VADVPDSPPPRYLDARAEFAFRYLSGDGLEIGGLHRPLTMPAKARVRYVDRMVAEELLESYDEEIIGRDLVEVDIVDDGETLATVAAASQDFIVANHFLEHTGDPIGTIGNHLRKLRPGGVLFYAVPDKRYSFDFRRQATTLDHMIRDHEEGPEVSRREHYDEWGNDVNGTDEERALPTWPQKGEEIARLLEGQDYSIHHHVWTEAGFLELLLYCRENLEESFALEAVARNGEEIVVVLRKAGAWPDPPTAAPPAAQLATEVATLRTKVKGLEAAERELERIKRSNSWRVTEPLRTAKARLGGRR